MSQAIFPSLSAARCALLLTIRGGRPAPSRGLRKKHLEIIQLSGHLYYWMSSGLTQEEAVPSVLKA